MPGHGGEQAADPVQKPVYPAVAGDGLPEPVDTADSREHQRPQEKARSKHQGQLPYGMAKKIQVTVAGHESTGMEAGKQIDLL